MLINKDDAINREERIVDENKIIQNKDKKILPKKGKVIPINASNRVMPVNGNNRVMPIIKKVRIEDSDIEHICDKVLESINSNGLRDSISHTIKEAIGKSDKFDIKDDKVLNSESKGKKNLILSNPHSPGDVVMMTAAIRDLHNTYPGEYRTDVRCSCYEIFEGNPYITRLDDKDPDSVILRTHYPLIHESNEGSYHFIHGYRKHLETLIGKPIKQGHMKGDIHIRDEERVWYSAVREVTGDDRPFWIIDAGWKDDFTAKQWSVVRYQEVVDHFKDKIQFVQMGHKDHNHPDLKGVINMIGQTDLRQLIRLVYHSIGVLTPVSLPMTLAAAVPMSVPFPKNRACVVLSGGREPVQWQAYPNHQFLHTCGTMSCCDNGGCWKSRVSKLNDGDKDKNESLCIFPKKVEKNQLIAGCMASITTKDVVRAIERYYEGVAAVFKYHNSKTVSCNYESR